MSERELTCIVCPNGCALKAVSDAKGVVQSVTGFKCKRGETYARTELTRPERTLTALVQVTGGEFAMCPVRTSKPVAKELIIDMAAQALKIRIAAPVKIGDVVVENIMDTGADLIVCRDVSAV